MEMPGQLSYEQALSQLKEAIVQGTARGELKKLGEAKKEVLARFQPIFSIDHIPQLTEQEFRALLLFENNKHWTGISRHVARTTADMPLLRQTITTLLDEDESIENRFDHTAETALGIGKAQATVILQVVYPDKYGIWNRVSEGGLKSLNLWPNFGRGESMGTRYKKINETLLQLARDLSN
jgi:hypothetical protein